MEDKKSFLKKTEHITRVFFNNITESLPQYVFWKDVQSVYLGCNKNYAQLVGFQSPKDIIGKTDDDLNWQSTGDTAKTFQLGDQRIISGQSIINQEEILALPSGKKLITLVSKLPIVDGGKVIGIVGYFTDITDLKLAEERERAAVSEAAVAKAKAQIEEEMRKTVMVLVGDIVHDLRTPIATIRTISSLLSEILPNILQIVDEAITLGAKKIDLLSRKQMKFLRENRFVSGLDSSVNMMDDFINTSLIELDNAQKDDQSPLDLIKCSSRRVLERTLEAYPLDNHIKLHQNISYDFELMGNSILIMKILFNLIRNAVEQIHLKGKGEIFITTEALQETNLLKVKDTAGGASPEVLPNLFKPYYTTKKDGTGIGLAFCRDTMRKFGGDLTCNSIYGQSMEFILTFPKIKQSF